MCVNCDDHILNEAFELLKPLFNQYGQRNVIDAIHDWFHYGQHKNVTQDTLWERGFGQ